MTDWHDAFLRLVRADDELIRAEFDSLIAAVWTWVLAVVPLTLGGATAARRATRGAERQPK